MDGLLLTPDSLDLVKMFNEIHKYMNDPAFMELRSKKQLEELKQLNEHSTNALFDCFQVDLNEILEDRTIGADDTVTTNKKIFQTFCSYSNTCRGISNNLLELCDKEGTGRDLIIVCNVGHIIRLMDQLEVMLMYGYPDGAFRAWRSLYENIVVTTILLHSHDKDVFMRYNEHNRKKEKRRIDLYEELRTNPGVLEHNLPSINQEVINEKFERIRQKNGKDFFSGEYSWASSIIGKNRVTFRELEDFAGFSLLRLFYVIASDYSHSNFNNIADHLVLEGIHVGNLSSKEKSNRMLFLPMAAAILSLDPLIKKLITDYSNICEQDFNLTVIKGLQTAFFECLKETVL